jgi:succinate-semialdehyde dehydrogenase/glutarate-semialdehyde dehydrogenase
VLSADQSRQERNEMSFVSIDPTTEERLASFEAFDESEIERRLVRARSAFDDYRHTSFAERAAGLRRVADILEREKDEHARLMTREMGKLHGAAVAEAEKCAWVCRYYADGAADFLASEEYETAASRSVVRYEPLGAVLAIMPWNFPYWQAIRCAAPALMAGNVILLKHAPNVPQCALAIESLFARAGLADGVFQNLFVEVEAIPRVLDDAIVQAASLTGSVRAGASLASEAGARIKRTVLELGGSDPLIVMPSADLDRAVPTAIESRMLNNGQSCISAKRILVANAVADELEERFVDGVEGLEVGDPMEAATDVGPLAKLPILETLEEQVRVSVEAGARVRTGGRRPDRRGYFYQPTILTDAPAGCPAYSEELFGPVASVFRFESLDEAIELANATPFGLGASVWTAEQEEADRCARDLVAGQVFVNALVASVPQLPFGGVKQSGYGRELGPHAIREFVNVKTVWVG